MSKIFLDTNILVYTLDNQDKGKQKKARSLLYEAALSDLLIISTQVLQEFYVVATKKLGVDPLYAKNMIHNFFKMEVIESDPDMIMQAIDISIISQISYWDSLIIAAAEKGRCDCIYSEDLNPEQVYRGIRLVNPLVPDTRGA